MTAESQIQAMRKLGMTEEEIQDVLASDKAIDQGAKLFELSQEGKATEKKMRQADRDVTVYQFSKRTRKANDDKRYLIDSLFSWIQSMDTENAKVNNVEREIEFMFNDKKYKIVLSAPRS